jgi:NADH:ubiquinone oxidoreductase subunit 2 (subunit N)
MYMHEGEGEGFPVKGPVRWVLGVTVLATVAWGIFPASLLDLAADALPL